MLREAHCSILKALFQALGWVIFLFFPDPSLRSADLDERVVGDYVAVDSQHDMTFTDLSISQVDANRYRLNFDATRDSVNTSVVTSLSGTSMEFDVQQLHDFPLVCHAQIDFSYFPVAVVMSSPGCAYFKGRVLLKKSQAYEDPSEGDVGEVLPKGGWNKVRRQHAVVEAPCTDATPKMVTLPRGSVEWIVLGKRGVDYDKPESKFYSYLTETVKIWKVDDFLMDSSEATYGEVENFFRATGRSLDELKKSTGGEKGVSEGASVLLELDEAVDYCRWRGARIPTIAEWYHAASSAGKFRFPSEIPLRELLMSNRLIFSDLEKFEALPSAKFNREGFRDLIGGFGEWATDGNGNYLKLGDFVGSSFFYSWNSYWLVPELFNGEGKFLAKYGKGLSDRGGCRCVKDALGGNRDARVQDQR